MAAENVINSKLVNNATVAALVGDRVFPSLAEAKETLPFIVHELIAADRYQAADGYTGLGQMTYQIRCFAADRKGATALAKAVRIALDHTAGAATVSSQTVLVCTALGSDEAFEYRDTGGQAPVYESSIDFDVYVREAVS